jgi:hypothetical protein
VTPINICWGGGRVVSACPRLATQPRKAHAVAVACVRVCAWALCVRVGVSACRVSRYWLRGRRVPVVPVRVRALFSRNPLILKGCSRCSRCSRYILGHLGVIQGVHLDNAVYSYDPFITF